MNRFYDLAGLKIQLVETPQVLLDAIDKAFSLSRCDPAAADVVLKGRILEDRRFLEAMPAALREAYEHIQCGTDPALVCSAEGRITLISKGEESAGFACSAPPYDHIELFCQKLSHRPAPLVFQSVIMPLISELMARQGKLMMHAGCVATPQGEGILLLADSGGGKTTSVFSMVRAGFRFLSDDLVIATPGRQGLVLIPIREKINITKQTAGFFPELQGVKKALRKDKAIKMPVDPNEVFGKDQMADRARAGIVIVLKVARDGPRLEALAGSAMLQYLLKSNTFARRASLDQRNIETIWGLLQQCRLFRLVTGYQPHSLGKWLASAAAADWPCHTGGPQADRFVSKKARSRGQTDAGPSRGREQIRARRTLLELLYNSAPHAETHHTAIANRLFHRGIPPPLVAWTRYHRIDVSLADYIKNHARQLSSEAIAVSDFEAGVEKALARSLLMLQAAETVCRKLADSDVSALLLRGPALALSYYPSAFLRQYRDLDVIVPRDKLETAEAAIHTLGFVFRQNRQRWMERGELPFSNGRIWLELHWDAYPVACRRTAMMDTYWDRPQRLDINGLSVLGLDVNHLLLSSCLHAVCEHKLDRLARLVDIHYILTGAQADIDWEWLEEICRRSGNRFAVWQALRLSAALFDSDVPVDTLLRLAPARISTKAAAALMSARALLATPGNTSRMRRWLCHRFLLKDRSSVRGGRPANSPER